MVWLADGIIIRRCLPFMGLFILVGHWLALESTSLIGWKILCIIFEALVFSERNDGKFGVAWIVCPLVLGDDAAMPRRTSGVGFFVLALGVYARWFYRRLLVGAYIGRTMESLPPLLIVALLAKAEGEVEKFNSGGALGVGTGLCSVDGP